MKHRCPGNFYRFLQNMGITKYFLLLIFETFSILSFSQNVDSVRVVPKSVSVFISYISSMIYPGARIGVELPVSTKYLTINKKDNSKKELAKEQFLTFNSSYYHHPGFHDNIYLSSGWTWRRIKSKGFFTEFSPEAGISRTFLGGTTYLVDDQGNVSTKRLAGYYYALISFGGGIGYDFSVSHSSPLKIFSKLDILLLFPYNHTIYLRPVAEMGIIYRPDNFLRLKVKSKYIHK